MLTVQLGFRDRWIISKKNNKERKKETVDCLFSITFCLKAVLFILTFMKFAVSPIQIAFKAYVSNSDCV